MTIESGYLDGRLYASLHRPSTPGGTGVLFVPPFGWDDTCSYRARRAWAVALADAGYPVLRFDLPGTGDSAGGPEDSGLVAAWVASVGTAATWLREVTGVRRVVAVAIGLGGLLTLAAGAVDEAVLWGVPASGKAYLRELRAFARLAASGVAAVPEGAVAANGFLVSAETVRDLTALDVSTPALRRALVLGRDGVPAGVALPGVATETGPGDGYGALMAEPQYSLPPTAVMAEVLAWLGPPGAPGAADRTVALADALDLGPVRERIVGTGVLAEPAGVPAGATAAVFLNAGAIRRTGPNRMWVETARRWAARGVPVLRVDLDRIGDGAGEDCWTGATGQFYEEPYRAGIVRVLDGLSGVASRFVLAGLCSGAYWAFHAGQADPRVGGVVLLNPLALEYDPYWETVRESRVLRRAWQGPAWGRLLRGESTFGHVGSVLRAATVRTVSAPARLPQRLRAGRAAKLAGGDPVDLGLDRLRERGVRALVVFTTAEPLREEYARQGRFERIARWPNVRLALLDGPPDTHTLQPLAVQESVNALLDDELARLTDPPADPYS